MKKARSRLKKAKNLEKRGWVDLVKFGKEVGVSPTALKVFMRDGMPTEMALNDRNQEKRMVHLQTGKDWISANGRRIKGEIAKNYDPTPPQALTHPAEPIETPPVVIDDLLIQDNIESFSKRARKAEVEALKEVEGAKARKEPAHVIRMLQRNYVDTMTEARKVYSLKDEISHGMAEAWRDQIEYSISWADPIKNFIAAWPRAMAARLNPANPSLAEVGLRDSIEKELIPMLTRPLTKE